MLSISHVPWHLCELALDMVRQVLKLCGVFVLSSFRVRVLKRSSVMFVVKF